jgi:hypothetical protein
MKGPALVVWANRFSVSLAVAVVLGSSVFVGSEQSWFQSPSCLNLNTSFPALGIIRDKLSRHR